MQHPIAVVNHVRLSQISETVRTAEREPGTLLKSVPVHGEWLLDPEHPFQFRATFDFEGGTQHIEIDSPKFLGGTGSRPGPTNYCVVGMASCFALTFAVLAARDGVVLSRLEIDAECVLDFGRYLDVSDEPPVKEVRFRLSAEAKDTPRSRLSELVRGAEERCPAVFMLTHPIRVHAELT